MQLVKIDNDGFYIELVHVDESFEITKNYVATLPPSDVVVYRHKWDGKKWIEGLSDDEIAEKFGTSLSHAQNVKITELDLKCKETIYGRFKSTVNGNEYEFSYDSEAQKRFNGIGTLIYTGKIKDIDWTAYDSTGKRVRLTLDSTSFETVGMSALLHQNNNIVKFNFLLEQVNQAVTVEEVNAIVWEN